MSSVKLRVRRGRAVLVVLVCALAAGVVASPVYAAVSSSAKTAAGKLTHRATMLWKMLAAGASAVVLFSGAAVDVNAATPQTAQLTGWRNFASASATGRGGVGLPYVILQSTTQANPQRVRVLIQGARSRFVDTAWYMLCWREPSFQHRFVDGNFSRRMPVTLNLSNRVGGVRNWRFCQVYMNALRNERGALRVRFQARYRR